MTNDGGPAYPGDVRMRVSGGYEVQRGMSLHDYYAGQALTGLLAMRAHPASGLTADIDAVTSDSFRIADAMLAAREAGK